ncbi:prepilin-type N-terminal cleavage/methylation domain-containing protein [Terribacillus halophilus]|uniref:Prepilin-type N-terminal cleavage/methylation domain-containing protein n=1 Tax=Terribacillus halophilus TaxID=361279 RepID=A0A1G6SFU7_9BACI|nr:prepilin-type N-terminal cleavage/methylation domain-containing protein [Terribacillus halophilus]SDD15534.1 prepilin-type N-terminal cleavage/methylation domain-containing protein [Terribacillus halophilus]
MKFIQREQGFTLVEILVSLTILAIIIIAFVPIFTQAAIHNKINGNILKTNEAAHLVASKYENLADIQGLTGQLPSCDNSEKEIPLVREELIGDTKYKTAVTLCKYETGGVENLIQATFITRSLSNPVQEGEARKFIPEVSANEQNKN